MFHDLFLIDLVTVDLVLCQHRFFIVLVFFMALILIFSVLAK